MTDYSDLIKRLRNPRKHPQQSPNLEDEVANALEAQAKRIAELEAALTETLEIAERNEAGDYQLRAREALEKE
jgi:hypothetical protein